MTTGVAISKRLATVNAASTVARYLVTITFMVWVQQYLIRRIPPEEYSLLPIVMVLMVFAPVLTVMLTGGIARYILEAAARNDPRGITQIVSTILPLVLGSVVLVICVLGPLIWFVGDILNIAPGKITDARLMLGITLLTFCARVSLSPFRVGFLVRQKLVLRNSIELGGQILYVAILATLLFTVSVRVLWIPVARLAAYVVEDLVVVTISRRLLPELRFRLSEFRRQLLGRLLSFGGWNVVRQIGGILERASDPIILNKAYPGPLAQVAHVQVSAFHVGSIPDRYLPPTIFEALHPLLPALTAMHASGDEERLGTTFLRGGRLTLWLAMLACTPLLVFCAELYRLYLGQQKFLMYHAAFAVTVLLVTRYPISYGRLLLSNVAVAKGRIAGYSLAILIVQILRVPVAIWLVHECSLGAIGSALSLLLMELVANLCVFWPMALRMLRLRLETCWRKTLLPGLAPMTASGAVGILLRAAVHPGSWFALAACGTAMTAVYLFVWLVFCMQPEDQRDMRMLLARLKGIFASRPSA
jgi:membrane protein EpsK